MASRERHRVKVVMNGAEGGGSGNDSWGVGGFERDSSSSKIRGGVGSEVASSGESKRLGGGSEVITRDDKGLWSGDKEKRSSECIQTRWHL